jgi:hypothetical protein
MDSWWDRFEKFRTWSIFEYSFSHPAANDDSQEAHLWSYRDSVWVSISRVFIFTGQSRLGSGGRFWGSELFIILF